jgi:uncharacterized membrane protein
MGKAEFLNTLEKKLRVLPENERRDALEYYDGYISDSESEEAAISELGTPGEVAAIILAGYVGETSDEKRTTEKVTPPAESGWGGMRMTWVIIIAIFAAPIAFPIIIVIAALGFTFFVVLASLIFAFAVTAFALFVGGIVSLVLFPFTMFQDFAFSLVSAGTGLIALGLGILFVKLAAVSTRGFPAISRFISRKLLKNRRVNDGQ